MVHAITGPNGSNRSNLQNLEGAAQVDRVLRHACVGIAMQLYRDVVALLRTFQTLPDEHGHARPCHSARLRIQVPQACVPRVVVINGVTAALPSGPLAIFRHFSFVRSRPTKIGRGLQRSSSGTLSRNREIPRARI